MFDQVLNAHLKSILRSVTYQCCYLLFIYLFIIITFTPFDFCIFSAVWYFSADLFSCRSFFLDLMNFLSYLFYRHCLVETVLHILCYVLCRLNAQLLNLNSSMPFHYFNEISMGTDFKQLYF